MSEEKTAFTARTMKRTPPFRATSETTRIRKLYSGVGQRKVLSLPGKGVHVQKCQAFRPNLVSFKSFERRQEIPKLQRSSSNRSAKVVSSSKRSGEYKQAPSKSSTHQTSTHETCQRMPANIRVGEAVNKLCNFLQIHSLGPTRC